ncbi:MAG: hypothetical protein R8M45_09935 [Ghiorsea sp.]
MIQRLVITDALLQHDGKLLLHPALRIWEKKLLAMRQYWLAESSCYTPLSWFAHEHGVGAPSLLASLCHDIPPQSQQYWLVSPYHARLTRAELRVMPECMLDCLAEQAQSICELLNPMLAEDGMSLHAVGSALLLACDRLWHVQPTSFAAISGNLLPNRSPDGDDAMLWMRISTEIQMMLHQHPIHTAQGLAIHGLWCWAGEACNKQVINKSAFTAVATRNASLQSVLHVMDKEQGASLVLTQAEQLDVLLQENMDMPKECVLLGDNMAVKLKKSLLSACLHKIYPQTWKKKG